MGITRINEFQAAEGKAEELFDFLKSLMPYILSSEGCLACEVLRSDESTDKFLVIEKWQSVEAHTKSIEGYPKEEMQAAMGLLAGPPKANNYHS